MIPKTTASLGIIGALLFISTVVVSGFLLDNYSRLSQFISEAYALGTPYGVYFRFLGYLPSGIMLALFGFNAYTCFKKSSFIKIGFLGFAIFYGLGVIMVSIFPCDAGCKIALLDSSISQIIHNLFSALVYLCVPWCMIAVGFGFRKLNLGYIGIMSMILGLIGIIFSLVLFIDPSSKLVGLFQRIIEGSILSWVFIIAIHILKKESSVSD